MKKKTVFPRLLAAGLILTLSMGLAAYGGAEGDSTANSEPAVDVITDEQSTEADFGTETDSEVIAVTADVPFEELDADLSDADYYEKLYWNQIYNIRLMEAVKPCFTDESYEAYLNMRDFVQAVDLNDITDAAKADLDAALSLQQSLVQVKPYAECVWYIWGDDIAVIDEDRDWQYDAQDNEDFIPFLVPYVLEDQSQVKGNIIVVAGGGYTTRENASEGWPIAEKWNELGYNAFVLQRRVAPYRQEHSWMDLQRAVRYIRANGESLGLGALDMIGASGFSGGGSTIMGEIQNAYGNIQPTKYDSDYNADEVDAVSADLDCAFIIYGPRASYGSSDSLFETENQNLPAFFIAAGSEDATGAGADSLKLAQILIDLGAAVDLHYVNNAPHGFGTGNSYNSSGVWMETADFFIDSLKYIPEVEWPNDITKYSTVEIIGNSVYVGTNDDETSVYCYIYFSGMALSSEGTRDASTGEVVLDGLLKTALEPALMESWPTEWIQLAD